MPRSGQRKYTNQIKGRSPPNRCLPSKREITLTPKKVDLSPTEKKKFDFGPCMLTDEEKNENVGVNEAIIMQKSNILRKRQQTAKNLKFSFESFQIYVKNANGTEGERPRNFSVPSEKSTETITRTGSNFNLKFAADKKSLFGMQPKRLTPSIEELMPIFEKNSPIKLSDEKIYKCPTTEHNVRSFDSGVYHDIGELEFDKMKIYKFYFIHNNIDQIIARANMFIQRRRVLNPRKNRKILVKQACKRKVYPTPNTQNEPRKDEEK